MHTPTIVCKLHKVSCFFFIQYQYLLMHFCMYSVVCQWLLGKFMSFMWNLYTFIVHTVLVIRHINCKYIEKVAKTITIGSHYLVYVRKDYYIVKEGVCLRQIRMFKTAVKNVFKIKANYWFMTQLPVNKSCLAWHITTSC